MVFYIRDLTIDYGSLGFDAFGEVLKPSSNVGPTQNAKTDKLLNKDLDSSLASLAGNLNINPAASVKK